VYVRRCENEAFKPECLVPTVKHRGGKIMVWGCFTGFNGGGKSQLYWIKETMNKEVYQKVLRYQFLPAVKSLAGPGGVGQVIVQQDNDPKHMSHVCQKAFHRYFPNTLDWVLQSPDMNPIEHVWQYLERRLHARNNKPKSPLTSFPCCRRSGIRSLSRCSMGSWNPCRDESKPLFLPRAPPRVTEHSLVQG